jgi:hypothetical protein
LLACSWLLLIFLFVAFKVNLSVMSPPEFEDSEAVFLTKALSLFPNFPPALCESCANADSDVMITAFERGFPFAGYQYVQPILD